MLKIGLDVGYGYLKGVNNKGNKIIIPSIVSYAVDRSLDYIFAEHDRYAERDLVISATTKATVEDGELKQEKVEGRFFIGELAQKRMSLASYVFDSNKIMHPHSLVLIGAATALLAEEGQKIHVITGPPLKYIKTQKQIFKEALENYRAYVKFANGLKREISFDRVTIFPQGAAALYALFSQKPEYYTYGFMIMVEIGFKTTELLAFEVDRDSETIEPLYDLSTTIDVGTSKVAQAVAEIIYDKYGLLLEITDVEDIIKTGRMIYKGKEHDLTGIIEKARQQIADVIINNIKNMGTQKLDSARFIFIAGGGAKSLYPYISREIPNTITLPDAQMLNAYGYLKIGELIEAKLEQS